MKIGIITLVSNNYGNRLQNYAVQEILKEYGDVYTIKQEKKTINLVQKSKYTKLNPFYIMRAIDSRLLNLYCIRNAKRNVLSKALYFVLNKNEIKNKIQERNMSFKKFDEEFIKFEEELLHLTGDDEEKWVLDYDAWVCGSDQIWNPTYPTATRNAFLQFAEKDRRISFSASIGLSDVKDMPKEYEMWIGEIPYLSVREEAAAKIVKELTNRESNVFLDPTMILSKNKWEKLADSCNTKLPKKYALTYFLGTKDKLYDKYISKQIKKNKNKLVELLNGEDLNNFAFNPAQVVDAIRKADTIYTDSFHGVVFAILFHKQFVVFQRQEAGKSMNSRLETLLKKFNLQNRLFNSSDEGILNELIDYSEIDNIIEIEKSKVKTFLDKAFNNIKKLDKEEVIKKKYIVIKKKDKCFGCTACAQSCPVSCIEMKEDEEGFLYPCVNKKQCVGCGKCISVCPYYNRKQNEISNIYAAINNDSNIRKNSSSGGTFYEIAKHVISNQGVVYGCAWDDSMVARHIRIDDLKDIIRLQGSKYVQSHLGDSYSKVKQDLINGTLVLFSGTPCQVAGLKNYLGNTYKNLILLDVLCHGVPSPKVLKDYVSLKEAKFDSKIIDMNLRDKKKSWHRLHTNIKFANGSNYFVFCEYDKYMSMFLKNISLRPSCFNCKFTTKTRQGDITLGDFWGIGKHIYDMDDDKGTSLVSINSMKGKEIWNVINQKFKFIETSFNVAEAGNTVLSLPTMKNKNRDDFYDLYAIKGYEIATNKYVSIPSKGKQKFYDFRRVVLDILRFILRKKY